MRKLVLAGGTAAASLGLLLLAAVVLPHAAGAQGEGRRFVVAVMPFEFVNASPSEAAEVTRRVQSELTALRKFTVVEQSQADEFMKETLFRQEPCAGVPCAQRLGRTLGVDKVVTGTVVRKDELHWLLSAELIDVASGRSEKSVSIDLEGQFGNLMADAPARVAEQLAEAAAVTRPAAPPRPMAQAAQAEPQDERSGPPRAGWALYTGYVAYSGAMKMEDGSTVAYSGGSLPTFAIEYQWKLESPLSLGLFFEISGPSRPSGKLGKLYNSAGTTLIGAELRYWTDRWYVGGNLALSQFCFFDLSDRKHLVEDLCLHGTALGPVAGYQFANGWFVGGSLDYADLSADERPDDDRVPRAKSATETHLWLNVGYRWGQD